MKIEHFQTDKKCHYWGAILAQDSPSSGTMMFLIHTRPPNWVKFGWRMNVQMAVGSVDMPLAWQLCSKSEPAATDRLQHRPKQPVQAVGWEVGQFFIHQWQRLPCMKWNIFKLTRSATTGVPFWLKIPPAVAQ